MSYSLILVLSLYKIALVVQNYIFRAWLPRVHAHVAGVIGLDGLHCEKFFAARAVQARPEHDHADSEHTGSMQIIHLILRREVVILFCCLKF